MKLTSTAPGAGSYILRSVNVFGGCCGSDLQHVTEIAHALAR
jgi:methionine synthase I (cobalamin-dependent)